jgi:Nucleoside-diphosphate-sugar epimerases
MKTVLVTGAEGFIGKNLCTTLSLNQNICLLKYDIKNTDQELEAYVSRADCIFHLAGINRPKGIGEFDSGNRGFTEKLLQLIDKSNKKVPIVLTSSIQALLDNPYGKSKKAAEEAIKKWSEAVSQRVYIYRLPNVFGKWCRPNYNSVVATFCNNIATGEEISINDKNSKLSLAYIDDIVKDFLAVLDGKKLISDDGYCYIAPIYQTTVGELADLITRFNESRKSLVMPELKSDYERDLYATFISYLPKNDFSYHLDMKQDNRGWLAEFIKSENFGQIFISKTKPGIIRGNHWHHTKIEKFLVIQGDAVVKFRKIDSDEVIEYPVTGEKLEVVDIPAGYTHSITNTGNTDLVTLFWADQIFDQEKPDTYYLGV